VVVGWVLFGARSGAGAVRLLERMFGVGGGGPGLQLFDAASAAMAAVYLAALAVLACAGPNTQEIAKRYQQTLTAAAGSVRQLHPAWVYPGLATLWVIGMMVLLTGGGGGGSPFMYAIF